MHVHERHNNIAGACTDALEKSDSGTHQAKVNTKLHACYVSNTLPQEC